MPTDKTHGSVLQMMDSFLHEVDLTKQAAANLDLAGDAKTTHPSAGVDDSTKPATEGSRSAENEADVKKEVPGTINDASSKNQEGGSKKPTDTQGTVSMASDEGLKGNVDTPKKDHSKSMTDKGPGDDTFSGDWDKASAAVVKIGNDITAQLAVLLKQAGAEKEAAMPPALKKALEAKGEKTEKDKKEPEKGEKTAATQPAVDEVALYKQAADQFPDDMEAGYVAATLLAQQLGLGKAAAADEAQLTEAVAGIRKQAGTDAKLYAEFMRGYQQSLAKAAQDPAALAAMAGGGGAPMAGAPGAEELAGLAGGAGEGGGLEGGLEGGGEGGLGDEETIQAIAEALDEAGVTPEELAAAVAEAQGGEVPTEGAGEGGEGGEAGELGEEGASKPEQGEEGGEKMSSANKPAAKTAKVKTVKPAAPVVKKASANRTALKSMIQGLWKQ